MANVAEILFAMRAKGARIWTDSGRLLYDAPRGALSGPDLETLRAWKPEIIAFLGRSAGAVPEDPPLGPRQPDERIPLTPVQSYFYNRIAAKGGRSTRAPAVLTRLMGPLDIEALEKALIELVRRHEILRARIVVEDGAPTLEIAKSRELRLETTALPAASLAAQEAAARREIRDFIAVEIDVATDWLFSARLVTIGALDHVLLLAMDHIIFDAPSMDILQRDICALYAHAADGKPHSLPDIPAQFADFAVWHAKVRPTHLDPHDAYWRDRLRGAGHTPVFTPQRSRCAAAKAARWRFRFDRDLTAQLRAFSLRHKTTVMMSVLTAYAATLFRWCRTADLVVPVPAIARRYAQLQNTVGPLGTVLYLRLEVRDGDSFLDLLNRVVGEYDSAHQHDDGGRTFARTPPAPFAANSSFNFSSHDYRASLHPALDWSAAGPRGQRLRSVYFQADIPFSDDFTKSLEEPQLLMFDVREEMAGVLVYRADRAGLADIRHLERTFRLLARTMIENPAAPLPRLDIPNEPE